MISLLSTSAQEIRDVLGGTSLTKDAENLCVVVCLRLFFYWVSDIEKWLGRLDEKYDMTQTRPGHENF